MKNLIERIEARLDDWGAKLEKKNIEYPVDLICGILFLVIGIVLLLIMPQQVQISEKDVVNGRAFPTMLIWPMLAMSAQVKDTNTEQFSTDCFVFFCKKIKGK